MQLLARIAFFRYAVRCPVLIKNMGPKQKTLDAFMRGRPMSEAAEASEQAPAKRQRTLGSPSARGAPVQSPAAASPFPPADIAVDMQQELQTARELAERNAAAALEVVSRSDLKSNPPALASLLIEPTWKAVLTAEMAKDSFKSLERFLQSEWASKQVAINST